MDSSDADSLRGVFLDGGALRVEGKEVQRTCGKGYAPALLDYGV